MTKRELHLLSLYDTVFVPILSEWISDVDLCCLDSALCCVDRPNFLRTLERCSIVNTTAFLNKRIFEQCKSWLLLRGLGLKKYNTDCKITKEERELLFKNNHLLELSSGKFEDLVNILETGIIADRLNVYHIRWPTTEALEAVGSHLTSVVCERHPIDLSLAKACPNLRSIDSRSFDVTLSVVDHCPLLDTVYFADLRRLRDRTLTGSFLCDLKRTYDVDESALCLGEDKKYFHITGLFVDQYFTEDDAKLTLPMIQHLVKLTVEIPSSIVREIAVKCHSLTCLTVNAASRSVDDFLLLLSHSPKLRHFDLTDKTLRRVDPFIVALSRHCPLLESYNSLAWLIENPEVLPSLFEKCSLMAFKYKVGYANIVVKSRGFLGSVRYPVSVRAILQKDNIIDSILQALPHVTSLNIDAEGCAINLERQVNLRSLSILRNGNLISLPKVSKLKNLVIGGYCNGAAAIKICSSCPDLTQLEVSNDWSATNDYVISLLRVCPKIEYLRLINCSSITVELVSRIHSTSLVSIDVTGTITKENLKPEEDKLSFRVVCG